MIFAPALLPVRGWSRWRSAGLVAVFFLLTATARAQDGAQRFAELGLCKLESGQIIQDCRVGYRTFGQLNAAQDNAVLVPTWLYGRSAG